MADWANQNQVIGIFIKGGFGSIHYPRPMGIVHVKYNMQAITTVPEINKYFTHKLAFYQWFSIWIRNTRNKMKLFEK